MLTERQFQSRDERNVFYAKMRLSHRDVIRGTEQLEGKLVWWVMYGVAKEDSIKVLEEEPATQAIIATSSTTGAIVSGAEESALHGPKTDEQQTA